MKMNKLIAQVVEDQDHLIKTCESLGFRRDKVLKDKAVDLYGEGHNLVIMSEDVDALWKNIKDLIDKDTADHSRG
jgi:dihydropteroate synthase